jgi:hypothetical protein
MYWGGRWDGEFQKQQILCKRDCPGTFWEIRPQGWTEVDHQQQVQWEACHEHYSWGSFWRIVRFTSKSIYSMWIGPSSFVSTPFPLASLFVDLFFSVLPWLHALGFNYSLPCSPSIHSPLSLSRCKALGQQKLCLTYLNYVFKQHFSKCGICTICGKWGNFSVLTTSFPLIYWF